MPLIELGCLWSNFLVACLIAGVSNLLCSELWWGTSSTFWTGFLRCCLSPMLSTYEGFDDEKW